MRLAVGLFTPVRAGAEHAGVMMIGGVVAAVLAAAAASAVVDLVVVVLAAVHLAVAVPVAAGKVPNYSNTQSLQVK